MKLKRDEIGVMVFDDLYEVGPTLDCGPIIGHDFYVVVQMLGGRRFAHTTHFRSHINTGEFDDDGFPIYDNFAEAAERAVERLRDRIWESVDENGVITLDDQYWEEITPMYGSLAYVDQGIEHQRWLEERYGPL